MLHFMSLDTYQFIGGPFFNSIYTRSEPKLWMSSDPVALDRSIFERINVMRRVEGFPEIYPLPQQLLFAASLGLGFLDLSQIKFVPIQLEHESKPRLKTTPHLRVLKSTRVARGNSPLVTSMCTSALVLIN